MIADLTESIRNLAYERYKMVMEQREEILTAFIAKYGMHPDEVEQIEQYTSEGIVWSVRKKGSGNEPL